MRHSLVTGGQGFIGSQVAAELLARGNRVTVVDLPGRRDRLAGMDLLGISDAAELIEADLAEPGAFEASIARARSAGGGEPVETVFHLAAQTIVGEAVRDPGATYEANVTATWRVLEACRAESSIGAVIVASSDKAYGPSESLPYREAMPLAPSSPYEASKAACDLIARSHAATYGLPVAVTRLSNVYGGGDTHRSRLVPEAISAILKGRRAAIRSDGTPERDYLHVSDAVTAYLALADAVHSGRGHGRAFNAGTGRPVSVRDLLRTLSEATGVEVRPEFESRAEGMHEIDLQFVDPSALHQLTGWSAEVDLEAGLIEAVEWYRGHPEALS